MNFNRILMIDVETTSLDTSKAKIWEIGAALVSFPHFGTIEAYEYTTGVLPEDWAPSTLEWATKTYPEHVLKQATSNPLGMVMPAIDFINWASKYDLDRTIVMCNHPEFDISVLKSNLPAGAKLPWKHRNVQDLQSVIWGLLDYNSALFKSLANSPSTGKTTHRAFQDCLDQVAWLQRAFVMGTR